MLPNQYYFLLTAFVNPPIAVPESLGAKKIIRFELLSGIPEGFVLGPIIHNLVLDGLEPTLHKVGIENFNYEQRNFAEQQVKMTTSLKKRMTNFTCIRYGARIIIFGFGSREIFLKIQNELVNFLQSRGGLRLEKSVGNIKVFCPGNSFEFLGFEFCFPDYKNSLKKLNKGRFTEHRYDLNFMSNYKYSEYHRSNPFIRIATGRYAEIKSEVRQLFSRRGGLMFQPVHIIINIQNTLISTICNYYNISHQCRIQLDSLNYYFIKRMRKIIKKKFSSTKKRMAYIKFNFMKGKRFCDKRAVH